MNRPSWGALLRRDLVTLAPLLALGCEPPPVLPVVAPPPPASQPAPPEPPPPLPSLPLGLGPAVDLFPAAPEAPGRYLGAETIPFGRGVLSMQRWHGWEREFIPRCPVKELHPERCEAMRVAPVKSATQEAAFPRWEGAPLDAWSAPQAPPRAWTHFSGGQRGVYAFAPGEHQKGVMALDVIDEHGKITAFEAQLTENPDHGFSGVAVVETPAGRRILGQRSVAKRARKGGAAAADWDAHNLLVLAEIEERGGTARVVRPKPLKIWPMTRDEGNAQYARSVIAQGLRVAYGPWQVVAAIDAKGKPERSLFLVWTEVTPPARIERTTPRVDAPPAPAAHTTWQRVPPREAWMGSMGCGAPSRKLSEESAKKQMHVTRLSLAGDILQDATVPFPAGFDPSAGPLPVVVPLPGGLQVGSLLLDAKLHPSAALAPVAVPVVTPAPSIAQGLVQAAFDPVSHEGLVIIQQGEKHLARRFDAAGKPVGEVLVFAGDVLLDRHETVLGRGARGWVALGGGEHRASGKLYPIGASREPFFVPGAEKEGWSYWPTEGWGNSASFKGIVRSARGDLDLVAEGIGGNYLVSVIDPDAGRAAPPVPFAGGPKSEQRLPGWVEGEHGFLFLGETTLNDEAGAHPLPDEATTRGTRRGTIGYHRVWNDVVMTHEDRGEVWGFWLRQGTLHRLPHAESLYKAAERARHRPINRDDIGPFAPPLLFDGRGLLPSTPGDAVDSPDLVALRDDCPFMVATEADRLVLVCVDVRGAEAAGTAVTLRTFRFEPPPAFEKAPDPTSSASPPAASAPR
jgi:hypothetical protein